jgi:hypothetical protein
MVLPSEARHYSLFLPRYRHLRRTEQLQQFSRWWIWRLVAPGGQPPFWLLGRSERTGGNSYVQFVRYLRAWALRIQGHGEGDLLLAAALAYYTVSSYLADQGIEPRFWVEKTPTNELRVARLAGNFPDARFIHVARDPRAIVAARQSMQMQMGEVSHHMLADVYWLDRSLAAGRRNLAVLGPERYHILRYEDLVERPEEVMTRLASFIGIEFTEALLIPTECSLLAVANSAYAQGRTAGRIHRRSLHRYKEQLSAEDLALVTGLTRRYARPYGYHLPMPVLRDLARGVVRAGLFSLRRQIGKLLRRID